MPRRRRLWSISVMIALRDKPLPFGPGRIGWRTLVAITISSRSAKSFSARPRISSLEPSEYMFAVSKKLMPGLQRVADERAALVLAQRPHRVAAARLAVGHRSRWRSGETSRPVVPSLM